jgi:hypothetical protein
MTTKKITVKSKFNIGDIVCMKDDFHFNPSYEVLSIGKVEAIHIHYGKGLFVDEDARGKITYNISGFSLMPEEDSLKLWNKGV